MLSVQHTWTILQKRTNLIFSDSRMAGTIKTNTVVKVHCVSKTGYHPTTSDTLNNSCPIPVTFGTNITE